MLPKSPGMMEATRWTTCAQELRQESWVLLWLYYSLARDLIQSLKPSFLSLCKMKVESLPIISAVSSAPVFLRTLVNICQIFKFSDEREWNYFYSFISMVDTFQDSGTRSTVFFFFLWCLTFYDSRMMWPSLEDFLSQWSAGWTDSLESLWYFSSGSPVFHQFCLMKCCSINAFLKKLCSWCWLIQKS